jgi:uncharacterized protein (DUF1697 family)
MEKNQKGIKTNEIFVALLRGINVGGKNSLPMKDLAKMFEKAGCEGVTTYIQSGNVVFRADTALAKGIPGIIPKAILKSFRMEVPVITRSAGELRKITQGNPFLKSGMKKEALHVAFLADDPGKAKIGSLDPERSPGDEFIVRGSEVYLHLPNGVGRTKLTNQYFDSQLATTSTLRNWKTVLKLLEMTEAS